MTPPTPRPDFNVVRAVAEAGGAHAQYVVGTALIDGMYDRTSIAKNPPAGEAWLQQAVRQGHNPATYMLGALYKTGADGVPANPARTLELWQGLLTTPWGQQHDIKRHIFTLVAEQLAAPADSAAAPGAQITGAALGPNGRELVIPLPNQVTLKVEWPSARPG